jgi:hypothetical protein
MSTSKAIHQIVSRTNSRAELFTTDLGLSAYEGRREDVRKALDDGIDWKAEGPYLLTSAIFGQQWEIARDILKSGMPISDSTYKEIYYWGDRTLLDELQARPDIIGPLEEESARTSFDHAVIEGDLETVRRLSKSEWLTQETQRSNQTKMLPIHYAASSCQFEVLQFLLNAGSEVNVVNGLGQSPLTLVTRWPGSDKELRKKCFHLLRSHGGEMIPPVNGWWKRWLLARGGWQSDF